MAEFMLKNARILVSGADLSGQMNEVTVTYSAEMLDRTTFGSSARKRMAGLRDFQVAGGGFVDFATTKKASPHLWSKLGTTAGVVTVSANSSKGAPCYTGAQVESEFAFGGSIGELAKFNFAGFGDGYAVKGVLAEGGTGLSTTLSATPRSLGVKGTTKRLYGIVHIRAGASSGNQKLVFGIQTASSSGFTSATTALKMTSVGGGAPTGQIKFTAGSTVHTWYRVRVKSSGTAGGKVTGFVAIAIQ